MHVGELPLRNVDLHPLVLLFLDQVGVASTVLNLIAVDLSDGLGLAMVEMSGVEDDGNFGHAITERIGDFNPALSILRQLCIRNIAFEVQPGSIDPILCV